MADIIQALMADIGSTLVDTPQQGKEKKLKHAGKKWTKKSGKEILSFQDYLKFLVLL